MQLSREDLIRRCNHPHTMYGARRVTVTDGKGRGQRLIEVKTAGGLRATFMEDKCLDILDLDYKGVNLAYYTKNGLTDVRHTETDSYLKYWSGGFMFTCGLRNVGPTCTVDGEFHPFHGRIGMTPAEHVNVKVNEEAITITGIARETSVFGHSLEMERTVVIPSFGSEITYRDQVRNLTPEEEHVFMLYHINFGYPFLSEKLSVKFPEGEIKGRTPDAEAVKDKHAIFTTPIDGEPERVFFHYPKDEFPKVLLHNTELGISAEVEFDKKQLPILTQWKSMRSSDYALGIEPCTNTVKGRAGELQDGYDIKVPGFGALDYGVTIKFR